MRSMRRRPTPAPSEVIPESRSVGEGPNPIERPGSDYVTPITRRDRAQREHGNSAERHTEQQRIAREEAHYRHGFPVAGHGEPEPVNRPRIRQRP